MTPISADGSCFELHVGSGDMSTFNMDTTGMTGFAAFTAHSPYEFENTQHYLKDSSGNDVEHVAEESAGGHAHHDHGDHGGESEIEAGEGEEAFDYDPHSWLDPLSFNEQLNLVLESLTTSFPDGADAFAENACLLSSADGTPRSLRADSWRTRYMRNGRIHQDHNSQSQCLLIHLTQV